MRAAQLGRHAHPQPQLMRRDGVVSRSLRHIHVLSYDLMIARETKKVKEELAPSRGGEGGGAALLYWGAL